MHVFAIQIHPCSNTIRFSSRLPPRFFYSNEDSFPAGCPARRSCEGAIIRSREDKRGRIESWLDPEPHPSGQLIDKPCRLGRKREWTASRRSDHSKGGRGRERERVRGRKGGKEGERHVSTFPLPSPRHSCIPVSRSQALLYAPVTSCCSVLPPSIDNPWPSMIPFVRSFRDEERRILADRSCA